MFSKLRRNWDARTNEKATYQSLVTAIEQGDAAAFSAIFEQAKQDAAFGKKYNCLLMAKSIDTGNTDIFKTLYAHVNNPNSTITFIGLYNPIMLQRNERRYSLFGYAVLKDNNEIAAILASDPRLDVKIHSSAYGAIYQARLKGMDDVINAINQREEDAKRKEFEMAAEALVKAGGAATPANLLLKMKKPGFEQ